MSLKEKNCILYYIILKSPKQSITASCLNGTPEIKRIYFSVKWNSWHC